MMTNDRRPDLFELPEARLRSTPRDPPLSPPLPALQPADVRDLHLVQPVP